MATANEQLSDAYIEHAHDLLKVSETLAKQVDRILVRLHRQLAQLVMDNNPTQGRNDIRIKRLDKLSRELVMQAYSEIARLMRVELGTVGEAEQKMVQLAIGKVFQEAFEDEDQ